MTINLSTFSLGKELVTVNRFIGVLSGGVITRTLDSTFDTYACVQPWESINPDLVQSVTKGNYPIRLVLMYSTVEVFLDDRNNANPIADEVLVLGKKWEPVKVDNWSHLQQQHYRTILREFDGY